MGDVQSVRTARGRRFGIVFAAVWLAFLVDPVQEALSRGSYRSPAGRLGLLALLALLAFAATYLATFAWIRGRRQRGELAVPLGKAVALLATMTALMVVASVAVGQSGTACSVFIAVVAVMLLPAWPAIGVSAALIAANELTARLVPGWSEQPSVSFAIATAAFAMWGVQQLMVRNLELLKAQQLNARLAIEEERGRFARDLHDILGHSLTVITVKAELAGRLMDVDVERARAEVAELERLSRDALVDVRRAVQGYREITLPGELARAREALRTAGIEAQLPSSTDEVESDLRDLFAWAVREGVTNTVRHSRARRCTVTLASRSMTVLDDGDGPAADSPPGHGLDGLRERAAKVGATVVTRGGAPRGFVLEVRG
ncbi:MAG TPA: histidine kinase [Angustibacter sp.]|nr:histidine kinase [Angustibacter sp.]